MFLIDEITPTRNFNLLYIILDSLFIVIFLGLLLYKKRNLTFWFAIFGGILYTIVDFGGFYLLSHTREVLINGVKQDSLMTFLVLLWMSMSYGITNFAFIWVLISKDKLAKYWLFMIIMWWLICPSIASMGGESNIQTIRTTSAYHGIMGIILVVSYLILIFILLKKEKPFVNILYLCLIGVSVQFCWEFALLINGIRPLNANSIRTLIVNSCLETNLGMPLIYLIYHQVRKVFNENGEKVKQNPVGNEQFI